MKKNQYALRVRCLTGTVLAMAMLAPLPSLAAKSPIMTDQGENWTDVTREKYYTEDQGSQVIPLKWINALKQADGAPFMTDNLSRYGFLPNPKSPEPGLPVGFTIGKNNTDKMMGLTCSACHTRQIDVSDNSYRIDGGPAIIDIQSFFADLDTAVDKVLTDPAAFTQFAHTVLGSSPKKQDEDKLRADVAAWFLPYDTIMKGSLPTKSPWGPSRLDAVSMIFNRISGLDIGPAPTYIIKENIKLADAPVRYPFLWNAP
ncbi:MAG: di-heme-cytochrome C peroxidase, partial [Gammaproteobacteria bacterium]